MLDVSRVSKGGQKGRTGKSKERPTWHKGRRSDEPAPEPSAPEVSLPPKVSRCKSVRNYICFGAGKGIHVRLGLASE